MAGIGSGIAVDQNGANITRAGTNWKARCAVLKIKKHDSFYNCNVSGCGGGHCVHELLVEKCPLCRRPMLLVKSSGFKFCSNPNTVYGCDYEIDNEAHNV